MLLSFRYSSISSTSASDSASAIYASAIVLFIDL